jgi:hypothetical protein
VITGDGCSYLGQQLPVEVNTCSLLMSFFSYLPLAVFSPSRKSQPVKQQKINEIK